MERKSSFFHQFFYFTSTFNSKYTIKIFEVGWELINQTILYRVNKVRFEFMVMTHHQITGE